MADYYDILNISNDASPQEIKQAYCKLALQWHPQNNLNRLQDANYHFREISEAFEVLSDANRRRIYDRFGSDGLSGNAVQAPTYFMESNGLQAFSGFNLNGAYRSPHETFRTVFGVNAPFVDILRNLRSSKNNCKPHSKFLSLLRSIDFQAFLNYTQSKTTFNYDGNKNENTKRFAKNGKDIE